ncbi:MAG TPA: FAD/NAD(P)-binding oxidoreductase [candidate division WOR-3 bacterium]|uniref:FAD/NAD(P)-binding oxidoreductase n=1 Tax=candidate division WOR-3 bacterium TaxID=2052148 RepID=A0A7V5LSY6_UNCW3|nr:NAD(P)/FAD-dependent oxidoreductase [Thermovirga sp.]HHF52755.1 FAD/NAD(P)-binding oxidoreductase [candidate division WOR-3 bacterium]
MERKKVVIIGAGVVGASIARVLSQYNEFDIYLLEKNVDAGMGVSKANTAIIHPGHEDDPKKYPLRAKLCVRGNRLWHQWVKELGIPAKFPGELMIAIEEDDLKVAEHYLELAQKNGVPGVRLVDNEELRKLEPNVNPNVAGALWAPTAGVMDSPMAAPALVENAVANGVRFFPETEVQGIKIENGEVKGVKTNKGFIEADIIINAAGLYSDKISKMAGIDYFTVHPRKGEYYVFDDDATPKVTRILHQTPTPVTKGVYVITEMHDGLMIGPTAEDLPEDAKEDTSTTKEGLDFVWEWAQKLVKELPPKNKVIRTFAGLRPEPPDGRWIIEAYDDPWGFINAAGIRSPGFTSAPAIAYYIVEELIQKKLDIKLTKKSHWNPYRRVYWFKDLPPEKQNELIKQDPAYGNVVCMCREITEGEIVNVITRMKSMGVKTITLDGIKMRTGAMAGTCQGSYCRIRIARIIARETGIPLWEVSFRGKGTEYGIGDVKVLLRGNGGDKNAE